MQSCGVKSQPLPIDFAILLVKSSHEIWKSVGDNVEKYLNILKKIAVDYYNISFNRDLITNMKKASILAAIKYEDPDGNRNAKYHLASAEEIFINDDVEYQQVFNPLTVPDDNDLKGLYKVC